MRELQMWNQSLNPVHLAVHHGLVSWQELWKHIHNFHPSVQFSKLNYSDSSVTPDHLNQWVIFTEISFKTLELIPYFQCLHHQQQFILTLSTNWWNGIPSKARDGHQRWTPWHAWGDTGTSQALTSIPSAFAMVHPHVALQLCNNRLSLTDLSITG